MLQVLLYSLIQLALCRKYATNSPDNPLVMEIHVFLRILHSEDKNIDFCWVPSHVEIEGNTQADENAREAASRGRHVAEQSLPMRDYYPYYSKLLFDRCESGWREVVNNKLRLIKDTIRPWSTAFNTRERWKF